VVRVDLDWAMRHARAMKRRSQVEIPADLRTRLESARLDLLALFRALDRMDLAPALEQLPQATADSGRTFPNAPILPSGSKSPCARACDRQKPTIWFRDAIPKTVKHPFEPRA
jgi:hypothetical protein